MGIALRTTGSTYLKMLRVLCILLFSVFGFYFLPPQTGFSQSWFFLYKTFTFNHFLSFLWSDPSLKFPVPHSFLTGGSGNNLSALGDDVERIMSGSNSGRATNEIWTPGRTTQFFSLSLPTSHGYDEDPMEHICCGQISDERKMSSHPLPTTSLDVRKEAVVW